jgi:hypothetical protein
VAHKFSFLDSRASRDDEDDEAGIEEVMVDMVVAVVVVILVVVIVAGVTEGISVALLAEQRLNSPERITEAIGYFAKS